MSARRGSRGGRRRRVAVYERPARVPEPLVTPLDHAAHQFLTARARELAEPEPPADPVRTLQEARGECSCHHGRAKALVAVPQADGGYQAMCMTCFKTDRCGITRPAISPEETLNA